MDFRTRYSEDERREQSQRFLTKYPHRVPVVLLPGNKKMPQIAKHKFLVPGESILGEFILVIRQQISIQKEQAIFVMVNNILPPTSHTMSSLYTEYQDTDGFLYISYTFENTFGSSSMLQTLLIA
jgi:GABA(A) receptor-associated protein